MDTTLFVTSDLSVGSVDGECLGVLVARGDDGPPQMEGASRRSLLPFLRLHDKDKHIVEATAASLSLLINPRHVQ